MVHAGSAASLHSLCVQLFSSFSSTASLYALNALVRCLKADYTACGCPLQLDQNVIRYEGHCLSVARPLPSFSSTLPYRAGILRCLCDFHKLEVSFRGLAACARDGDTFAWDFPIAAYDSPFTALVTG